MSLNDQIRRNSYEVKLTSDSSQTKEYELNVKAVDYAKTPDIRNQIPRGGVKKRLKEQEEIRRKRGKMSLLERRSLSGWLFALPFVLGLIFVYAPIIFSSIKVTFCDVATDGTKYIATSIMSRIMQSYIPLSA